MIAARIGAGRSMTTVMGRKPHHSGVAQMNPSRPSALLLGLCFAVSTATLANAAPVNPSSYDMYNGRTGTYAYWDASYSGSGSVTTDNAWLSGGLGDLTDGTTTNQNWYDVENLQGAGPYVGWWKPVTPSLTIRFNFAGGADIDSIHIHADDAGGIGDVFLPSTVSIAWDSGSAFFNVVDPNPGSIAPSWLDYLALGINDASFVEVSLGYNAHPHAWIFVDEVAFATAEQRVPEPSAVVLALAGFGALLATACTRRRVSTVQSGWTAKDTRHRACPAVVG